MSCFTIASTSSGMPRLDESHLFRYSTTRYSDILVPQRIQICFLHHNNPDYRAHLALHLPSYFVTSSRCHCTTSTSFSPRHRAITGGHQKIQYIHSHKYHKQIVNKIRIKQNVSVRGWNVGGVGDVFCKQMLCLVPQFLVVDLKYIIHGILSRKTFCFDIRGNDWVIE